MSASDELLAERERPSESDEASAPDRQRATSESSRLRDRLRPGASLRSFLLALLACGAGAALVGLVPFLPGSVASLVGVFAGTFSLGILRGRRAYLESASAGAAVGLAAALSQFLFISVVAELGVPIAAAGAGAGLLAGVVGHYFGRDLRAGLTREL